MKTIDSLAYLVCAGLLVAGSGGSHAPAVNAQSSQSQTDSQARQLQQQPPRVNTDKEWQAAVEFMKANCPNRIAFASQLQDFPLKFDRARELILKQYRQISNIKDPQIHLVAVRQAQIQDQVFGAHVKYNAARNRNDQRAMMESQTELKAAMSQLVDVQIALRKVRIEHLQTEIDRFQKRRMEYVNAWSNDELKKATANNLDGAGHDTGDAINDDHDAAPPAPPIKK